MDRKDRRAYEKPEIKQVRLVPEEAVLAGCKTALISGPELTGGCTISGVCLEQRS
jgi:hypothetical protein